MPELSGYDPGMFGGQSDALLNESLGKLAEQNAMAEEARTRKEFEEGDRVSCLWPVEFERKYPGRDTLWNGKVRFLDAVGICILFDSGDAPGEGQVEFRRDFDGDDSTFPDEEGFDMRRSPRARRRTPARATTAGRGTGMHRGPARPALPRSLPW